MKHNLGLIWNLAACSVFATVFAQHATAQSQSVVFDESRAAPAQIASARQQITDGQASAALGFLEQIARADGDRLARISANRYVAVRTLCQSVIGRLNADGLAEYRREVDPQVNQWLARARAGDRTQYERIISQSPNSSGAGDALWELGEIAWRNDQPGLAYEYWRRLLPAQIPTAERHYPGSRFPAAEVAARLVLCRLAMGDVDFARRELVAFRGQFPDARGTVSGEEGNLAELLTRQVASSDWITDRAPNSEQWRTVWSRRLNLRTIERPLDAGLHPAMRDAQLLTASCVLDPRGVFLADTQRVFALGNQNGLHLWTRGPDTVIFEENQQPSTNPSSGVPHFRPALADGRLLFRSGTPTTSHGSRQIDVPTNAVACLDIDRRQGKLLWRMPASKIIEGGAFESAPVVFGDRCFVAVRTSPPASSLHVICLSLEDGVVQWNRELCGGLDEPGELRSKATSVRPVVSSQHVIVPTDNGAIFALGHDGRMQWARTYSRSVAADTLSTGQRAVIRHGYVYVAPGDSDLILAIREHTGELVWQRGLADRIQSVIDVRGGTVVVSGKAPWGLVAATGELAWGGPRYSPERFGYGAGAISGRTFVFPTRDRIEFRDYRTGQSVCQPLSISGGHVTANKHSLAITTTDAVTMLRNTAP